MKTLADVARAMTGRQTATVELCPHCGGPSSTSRADTTACRGNVFVSDPVGGMIPYLGSTAPSSIWALPFGQTISRTGFPDLFSLTGTTFGAGDGSTTFNIIDMRGRVPFGLDNMGGSAAGRITVAGGNFDGTVTGNSGGSQNHTLTTAEMPVHSHANSLTDPGHTHGPRYDLWLYDENRRWNRRRRNRK